jgi:Ca2+-binding EF-hand superfamily protein
MKRLLCWSALCLLVSASAWAQPPQGDFDQVGGPPGGEGMQGPGRMGPPPNMIFEAIDVDGDGVITTREMRKAVVALKRLDADGDGNLTLAEVSPMGGPMGQAMGPPGGNPAAFVDQIFANDQNGDGVLAANELSDRLAPLLMGADTNGDGSLDRAEVTAAMEKARGRLGGPAGVGGFDAERMSQMLMQGDRNGDGLLTPDEVSPQARRMLQGADTNGDGAIDAQERQAAMLRASERMGRGRGDGPRGPQGTNGNPPQ